MNNAEKGVVKARRASDMFQNKPKVQFTPSSSSERRMEKASNASHIKNPNDIMRFERN